MQSEGWALNGRLAIGVLGDELKAEDCILCNSVVTFYEKNPLVLEITPVENNNKTMKRGKKQQGRRVAYRLGLF
jgi:hypothetical protein